MTDTSAAEKRIRVIAVGPGRTGSVSLGIALERLFGGKCYHWHYPGMSDEEHIVFAENVLKGKADANYLRDTFKGYTSVCGSVACGIWREMLEAYPDASIVILHREPEKWFQSMTKVTLWLMSFRNTLPYYILLALNWSYTPVALWNYCDFCYKSIGIDIDVLRGQAEYLNDYKDVMIEQYENFYVDVQKELKSKGTPYLMWRTSDGWEPLCKFLKLPVPQGEFPRQEGATDSVDGIKSYMRKSVLIARFLKWGLAPACLSAMAYAIFKYGAMV